MSTKVEESESHQEAPLVDPRRNPTPKYLGTVFLTSLLQAGGFLIFAYWFVTTAYPAIRYRITDIWPLYGDEYEATMNEVYKFRDSYIKEHPNLLEQGDYFMGECLTQNIKTRRAECYLQSASGKAKIDLVCGVKNQLDFTNASSCSIWQRGREEVPGASPLPTPEGHSGLENLEIIQVGKDKTKAND